MQLHSRWRNLLMIKNTIAPSTRIEIATASPTTTHLTSFHSASAVSEKWKNKFSFDVRRDQQTSKNYVRYVVRQKRADTKKALKSILYSGGCSASRDEVFSKVEADYADQVKKKTRTKSAREAKRACQKKLKRKHRRENLFEDCEEEEADRVFHAAFKRQGFTWEFRASEMGFDFRQSFGWSNSRFNEQDDGRSRIEHDNSSCIVGNYADRKILGLPTAVPLKIEDVKSAFRLAALKWHPDKHQGSSQASAEEKFKQCVDAYKSLCSALSAA